jgi:hypothetical protein
MGSCIAGFARQLSGDQFAVGAVGAAELFSTALIAKTGLQPFDF